MNDMRLLVLLVLFSLTLIFWSAFNLFLQVAGTYDGTYTPLNFAVGAFGLVVLVAAFVIYQVKKR